MKKILCVIDSLSSGGAQRQLVGLADLLNKKGYEVCFIWYHNDDFYKSFLENNGIRFINPVAFTKKDKFFAVYRTVKTEKPDIVISYIDSPNMICCGLRLLGIIKYLIVSERNTNQNKTRYDDFKFFLYHFADQIVANSESQGLFIHQNYSGLTKRLSVITNFVDTTCFTPLSHKQISETKTIVCVGRINRQKNIILFMDAIKLLKDKGLSFSIKWYGSNGLEDTYLQQCEKHCAEVGIGDVFEFRVATKNIKDVYQNADIFCLPSIFEGYPNVVCEAMSCGLPIVCSDVCDNGRIVKNGENGFLFNPTDVNSIAHALSQILKLNDSQMELFGQKSRRLAIELFSSDKFVNKYIEIFPK